MNLTLSQVLREPPQSLGSLGILELSQMRSCRTYQTAIQLYRKTRLLGAPRHLKDQLDRAASSVVLNLAEGWSKTSLKDRRRFFEIALCSLRETQAILELLEDRSCIDLADMTGACCYKLIKGVERGF